MDAGAKLVEEFNKWKPLQTAFWLKENEVGQWYFYLVSDQIDDTNLTLAYSEVIRIMGRGPHLWLDPIQVKVSGANKPEAMSVLEIQRDYPLPLPTRIRSRMVGDLYVDEMFLYPIPVAAPG